MKFIECDLWLRIAIVIWNRVDEYCLEIMDAMIWHNYVSRKANVCSKIFMYAVMERSFISLNKVSLISFCRKSGDEYQLLSFYWFAMLNHTKMATCHAKMFWKWHIRFAKRFFLVFIFIDELRTLFQDAGFTEDLNMVDRRLQINRGKQLKMYRVWIQAKYRKPIAV